MQISVTGKQIDVGDFLRGHVDTTMPGVVEKYFDRAIEAHVVFYRERHLIHADVSVHAGRGLVVQCRAEANDAYAAFDIAAERLDKQLRRYKRRLRRHHGRAKDGGGDAQSATAYVLAPFAETEEDTGELAGDDKPLVIAEMKTSIPQLSVSEAVMRLDLAALPALLFRNSAHGSLNMIYRRPDGNIGWIDPDLVANRSGGAQEGYLTDGNC
jgi:ribosomal subunit interface protein